MESTQTFMEIFDILLCPIAHSLAYLTLLYFKFIFFM